MDAGIISLLKELERVYSSISSSYLESTKKPLPTEDDVAELENSVGEKLPDDYRTFLLNNKYMIYFCFNYNCMPLRSVNRLREMMNELLANGTFKNSVKQREKAGNWEDGKIKKVWWSQKWIPFAEDSVGNMFCIDLDPGTKGTKYQIINMELQDGQGPYCSKDYSTFTDFLEKHLGYLKNEQYVLEDDLVLIDPHMPPKA